MELIIILLLLAHGHQEELVVALEVEVLLTGILEIHQEQVVVLVVVVLVVVVALPIGGHLVPAAVLEVVLVLEVVPEVVLIGDLRIEELVVQDQILLPLQELIEDQKDQDLLMLLPLPKLQNLSPYLGHRNKRKKLLKEPVPLC